MDRQRLYKTNYIDKLDQIWPPDVNIAQILHLSNFFELKRRVYINLQA
jgi:hypothetical protein